jgi:hypothetical protein
MAAIKNRTHLKNRIIQNLRRLTWSWQPIKDAEARAKVDKATFECEKCGKYVYTGKSEKNFNLLIEKHCDKLLEMGIVYRDHIIPVVPIGTKTKDMSMDEIILNMFCESADDIQILCKVCNTKKTNEENEERRK